MMSGRTLASWLNKNILPESAILDGKTGLCYQTFPDGQLASFGDFDNDGTPLGYQLTIEHNIETARAEIAEGSGGTPDYEVYRDGKSVRYDLWSDNEPPGRLPFSEWIKDWIAKISSKAGQRRKDHAEAKDTRESIRRKGKRGVIKIVK
jgi:hypothetical protein